MLSISKKGKTVLAIVGGIALIAVIVAIVIANKYSSKIEASLPERIEKITEGKYRMSLRKASINLFTRSITLKDVHVWADSAQKNIALRDSTASGRYYDITIPTLKISRIMWDKLTGGQGLSCAKLQIRNATIDIYQTEDELCKYDTAQRRQMRREMSANSFEILNTDIHYIQQDSNDKVVYAFDHSNVTLTNWLLNNTSIKDSSRFLLANKGNISVGHFRYLSPKTDYHFIAKNLGYSSTRKSLTAGDILLKLKTDADSFHKKYGVQKEIYNIHFPTFELTQLDWQKLIQKNELHGSTIFLNHSKVSLSFDRNFPENTVSKLGKYPSQLLQQLQLPVCIERVRIHDGSVTYSEKSSRTGETGSIHFTRIDGEVKNISNIDTVLSKNEICAATLNGKLNKYTDVNAAFKFWQNNTKGRFSVDMSIEGLQNHQINEQAKAFTLMEVKSLNMKRMTMQLRGDERYTRSDFKMLYNNLAIKIIKTEDDKKKEKRKKGLFTFIANNIILHSSNPMPGQRVRTIKTYIKRDETKSFFNQIWRNIHQGVQETTIRDMRVINWIRSIDEQNKAKQQKAMQQEQK